MGLEFVFRWRDLGWILSGAVALISLVWLLRSAHRSPLRNSFAILLAVFCLNGLLFMVHWVDETGRYPLFEVPDEWMGLAILLFLLTWLAAESGRPLPRWFPVPFLAGMALVALAWVVYPELRLQVNPDGRVWPGTIRIVEQVLEIGAGVALAVFFMRTAIRRDSKAHALVGFGFTWPMVFGVTSLWPFFNGGLRRSLASLAPAESALILVQQLTLVAAALYLVMAVLYMATRGERNGTRRLILGLVLGSAAFALLARIAFEVTRDARLGPFVTIVAGLTTLTMPVFGTLLLVADSNAAREKRVWAVVRRGSVPAVMVATFFVVTEGVQTVFAGALGPLVGLLATAPLVLLLAPIQRMAERFGHVVAPDARKQPAADREALYERQLRYAWVDGRINAMERARLVDLRRDLGLDADRADSIEQAVVARVAAPASLA